MNRKVLPLAAAAVMIALPLAAMARQTDGEPTPPGRPTGTLATSTAPVTRGTVTQRVRIAATLGFGDPVPVYGHLPAGIVTAVAEPGSRLERGDRIFAISGHPAFLFYGTVPAYRDFAGGMADGPDVRQLEENLVALGMDPNRLIRVDDQFTAGTAAAIARWQAARHAAPPARSGSLRFGEVVFLAGPVRVEALSIGVGAAVGPGGQVLSASSTRHVVTAPLTAEQRHLVRPGDRVQVTFPGGRGAADGTITAIGRALEDDAATSRGPAEPNVPVTISVEVPDGLDLDEAPVQVAITTDQHPDVLMVPVTALMARTGGGYQVRTVGPAGATRLIEVQPGLFDDTAGAVEVIGVGLAEGMSVEVPAP